MIKKILNLFFSGVIMVSFVACAVDDLEDTTFTTTTTGTTGTTTTTTYTSEGSTYSPLAVYESYTHNGEVGSYDTSYYSFTPSQSGFYSFKTDAYSSSVNLDITIYDDYSFFNSIKSASGDTTSTSTAVYLNAWTTYYFKVYNSSSTSVSFNLLAGYYWATTAYIDSSNYNYLYAGDTLVYSFYGTAGANYRIQWNDIDGTGSYYGDIKVSVYRADGTPYNYSDIAGGYAGSVFTDVDSGYYLDRWINVPTYEDVYIVVEGLGSTNSGDFTITPWTY